MQKPNHILLFLAAPAIFSFSLSSFKLIFMAYRAHQKVPYNIHDFRDFKIKSKANKAQ